MRTRVRGCEWCRCTRRKVIVAVLATGPGISNEEAILDRVRRREPSTPSDDIPLRVLGSRLDAVSRWVLFSFGSLLCVVFLFSPHARESRVLSYLFYMTSSRCNLAIIARNIVAIVRRWLSLDEIFVPWNSQRTCFRLSPIKPSFFLVLRLSTYLSTYRVSPSLPAPNRVPFFAPSLTEKERDHWQWRGR